MRDENKLPTPKDPGPVGKVVDPRKHRKAFGGCKLSGHTQFNYECKDCLIDSVSRLTQILDGVVEKTKHQKDTREVPVELLHRIDSICSLVSHRGYPYQDDLDELYSVALAVRERIRDNGIDEASEGRDRSTR